MEKRLQNCLTYFFVAAPMLLCSTVNGLELIQNSSFEADGPCFCVSRISWDDGPGRGNDIGFAAVGYPLDDNGMRFPETPGDGGDVFGKSWGAANGDGHRGSATQIVELAGHMGEPFQFGAWLLAAPPDYAIVSLEFFDQALGTGTSLGSLVFSNDQKSQFIVGAANDGVPDPSIPFSPRNWTFYRALGTIPINAESAVVMIRGAVLEGVLGDGNDAMVDVVSLQVILLPGDYDANEIVDQGDLDLALLNWGAAAVPPPEAWVRDLPSGLIDQAELDAVLLNWGSTQPEAAMGGAVPEPASIILAALATCLLVCRRAHRVVAEPYPS